MTFVVAVWITRILNISLLMFSSATRNTKTSSGGKDEGYGVLQGNGDHDVKNVQGKRKMAGKTQRTWQLHIIDRLHGEMGNRSSYGMEVNVKFGFLSKMERLTYPNKEVDIDFVIERLTQAYVDITAERMNGEVRLLRSRIMS